MIQCPVPGDPRTPPAKCPTVGGRATGGFLQYAQLMNPRNSMSITNTKGLLNMPGQNNCFLNSAVQVLWHLDIFRRSFRELQGHACMEDSCIFCALKELFAQFQYSQESALPPDALRRALAETFCDQRRFQLGFMDDAAECFENILMRIHFHIANNESEDMCSALHCIPHQKFAMTLVEQTVCHACGATSEPLPFTQMVHYVPSSALCSQAKLMKEKSDQMPSFSELLKRAGGLGDLRDCPSSCGAAIQIRKTLMNRPEIVSIGLVWDSEKPSVDHIMDVFKTIGMSLKLQDVFHSVVDSRWASTATHQLVGIVTYYGKHYSTCFFHTKLRVWIYFDDAVVKEIGPKWEQVVEKCCRSHFQPLLLLYANPHGTPVNTSSAPRVVSVVPGHNKNVTIKDSCSMIPQHDKSSRNFHSAPSSNQRRALTPNPEVSYDISATIQPRRAVTPSGELSWSDESTNDSNSHIKDSLAAFNIRNFNTYDNPSLHHKNRISDLVYSKSDSPDNSDQVKLNNISAHLSVPNCTYFSDSHQQKAAPKSTKIILNRPASIDDILKSARKAVDEGKPVCQIGENIDIIRPEELANDSAYIRRKDVENVMHLQKLQRQRSVTSKIGPVFVGQRHSSSSLESLDNVFILREKGSSSYSRPKLEFDDVMNIARRRDSGNWSGDRSSASSSSTTSLDNPYLCALGKRLPNCSRTIGRPGDSINLADPGYDSFSLSSSDSYPSAVNCPSGKLGQIPEHMQTAFLPYDLCQLQYCLKDIKSNDHFPYGFKDDCDKLCAEADIFVAKSIERENVGDISMAALLSDTAAAKARAAMDVPYTSSQALAMAKMKHSMCLIRSSNLHKKIKEAEAALCRKSKDITESSRVHLPNSAVNVKTHSDNGCKVSKEDSENVSSESLKEVNTSSAEQSPSDKNIEIYATLPKRSLKKKGTLSSFVESLTGEESSDEKCIKDVNSHKANEDSKSDGHKSDVDQEKPSKSSVHKKKIHSHKSSNKDSDLSDYSSEWEHTKKQSLYRTYSGPTNSKNELSDLNSNKNQTFNEHPTKKQHRIRRKLMGGFMRRKNRSLPDLREGQDSGSETTRSFDDCFFTQTPVSCRKKQDLKNSPENINSNHQVSKKSYKESPKSTDNVKQPKKIARTQTPPPYKPPPPIAPSNSHISTSPKKVVQYTNQEPPKDAFQSNHVINMPNPEELLKTKIAHHPPLCRDIKNHRKISAQYVPVEHSASNSAWLKELQMKQEEINQRKKLQEERERWLSECNSGINNKPVSSQNLDSIQNASFKMQVKALDEKDRTCKSQQRVKPLSNQVPISDIDNMKSVRDIASKFEKITVTPSNDEFMLDHNDHSVPQVVHSSSHTLSTSSPIDNRIYMLPPQKTLQVEHPRLHPSFGHRLVGQMHEKSPVKDGDSSKIFCKDRLNGVNCAKQVYSNQSTSGSVYSPHLTDAQLTNVLRIGTNRSSFRNSNGTAEAQDENFVRVPYILHEAKRPDKPPDYETAIQRLELLRNDRNIANFYAINNSMSFEALLEQARKKRGPKKSVTFSDKVVLVACAGDEDNDFIPNPLLERVYKQHFMQSSQPDIAPTSSNDHDQNLRSMKDNISGENLLTKETKPHTQEGSKANNQSSCHLCHKKTVEAPNLYCPDCAFYMSRFQQK